MYYSHLYHHGIKGQKWGVRRFQNANGSLTNAGRSRYLDGDGSLTKAGKSPYNHGNNSNPKPVVLHKKGESVELHQNPKSATAKFLAKLIPSLKDAQNRYKDYTVCDRTGNKIGNMSTNLDPDGSLNIVWLGINSKHEGNGHGQSAMRTIIDVAKKQGIKKITLEVPTTSPNARHIYEKLGFKGTGEKMLGDEDDVWGGLTKMALKL